MKFGEHLLSHKFQGWEDKYLDYDRLKKMIKTLEALHINRNPTLGKGGTSLSVPVPTNAAGIPLEHPEEGTQEQFYSFLEQEMKKIEKFTKETVRETREKLSAIEAEIANLPLDEHGSPIVPAGIEDRVDDAAEKFLQLEKYVNINFTGFHKILKKHDKRLPNPCKPFYIARLHEQSWVRGDYSDVIVTMSRIHSAIRGDVAKPPDQDEKQDFVRSTSKYWVHMEDVSRVKYIILQHLPVFLQDSMHGETDAQLVNSVYLDNRSFELYRGRLDKTPGAIALRMRWYGTSIPKTVFVERKTHRESWMGELSVKERFVVQENQVLDLIRGKYNKEAELERMAKKGTKADVVGEWRTLVDEVEQAIIHKQLEPAVRTQCMRTAFQIPFDATVRISLDTNLCMINERTENVVSGERWYRDPSVEIPKNEITRFPHAILEVKLQLQDEDSTPQWVTDLIHSGMLLEVHKFSKFIHGCATLMPDEVQTVPYWIDDPTLAESLKESGAGSLLEEAEDAPAEMRDAYAHVLPHDKDGKPKLRVRPPVRKRDPPALPSYGSTDMRLTQASEMDEHYEAHADDDNLRLQKASLLALCCGWAEADAMSTRAQKIEPKLFFANERTFMKWLEMAVLVSAMATGILAFSKTSGTAQIYALILLPIALFMICYSVWTYLWRSAKIGIRDAFRWDDPMGPIIITSLLIIALCTQFIQKIMQVYSAESA